ncbi:hypothetical protein [Acidiphilium multivorum]|nr:hypothetical protein [Acidiphilium multivorum]MBS3025520.1 hypothetical protein [Acidiphilium multivorum]
MPIDLAALPDDPGILRDLVSHAEHENAGLRSANDDRARRSKSCTC